MKFAGGHDPGPLALPGADEPAQVTDETVAGEPTAGGPWGGAEPQAAKPFLPGQPPIANQGPWGPKR